MKLHYPLVESELFLQRTWVSSCLFLYISQIVFAIVDSYLHHERSWYLKVKNGVLYISVSSARRIEEFIFKPPDEET